MHRIARVLAMMPVVALTVMGQAPDVRPQAAFGGLVGRWQVSRTCAAGCRGSSTVTEVVRARGHAVYMATGGQMLVLYQVGTQVLVHGQSASSLLEVRVSGELMTGSSVTANGSTLTTTWRCVGAPAPYVAATARDGTNQSRPAAMSAARVRC